MAMNIQHSDNSIDAAAADETAGDDDYDDGSYSDDGESRPPIYDFLYQVKIESIKLPLHKHCRTTFY